MPIVGVNGVFWLQRNQLDHPVIFFGVTFLADEVICHPFSLYVLADRPKRVFIRIARAAMSRNYFYLTMNGRWENYGCDWVLHRLLRYLMMYFHFQKFYNVERLGKIMLGGSGFSYDLSTRKIHDIELGGGEEERFWTKNVKGCGTKRLWSDKVLS